MPDDDLKLRFKAMVEACIDEGFTLTKFVKAAANTEEQSLRFYVLSKTISELLFAINEISMARHGEFLHAANEAMKGEAK